MVSCAVCGFESESGFKFCPECGTPHGAQARDERKVVTALFCDLVGFTALSEAADPEDVDAMLARYFEMARRQIERHGGVVEKFIGDAVVGVFGVPAAHEDDAERAVRAGLRIVEDARGLTGLAGMPLLLRVGINTGEALVRLGVAPGSGDGFLTGDAVNTAARLQAAAPEMGVAVGPATYEATAAAFDYDELEAATLKGKGQPVRVFRATSARAQPGAGLTRTLDRPFVGREIDLGLLKGIFDRMAASSTPHLATIVGEPGLGKSRIVAELGVYVAARDEPVTWRQGRCLPYGDGITFWALGEIVKEHAGIFESDPPSVAAAKLDAVLPAGSEREWFRRRLLPLLGLAGSSAADREELFTAWARFLESFAEERPTVLAFEDLHWADGAMLEFIEHLAERAERVPLLVVATARPELYDRRREYAAGVRNATTISLSPLSHDETGRLVAALLETTALPAEFRQPIVERAEGNPLYAEEFVRLLKDRGLLVRTGATWVLREGAEAAFPASVQALIAARIDLQSPDAKSMLADAAVVGRDFWAGALAAMGDRDAELVVATLRELSRSELVQPVRRSSIQGEAEYAFWHILTRDVAYAQLPRTSRASRHVAAAAWFESSAGDRLGDHADVLAHHYETALELTRAAGQTDQAAELVAPTLRFLTLAGERALGLDTGIALESFERARALTPPGHPGRPMVLARFAEAAHQAGRNAEAREALEEAADAFTERGDLPGAAAATATLAKVLYRLGDPRALTLTAEALALLEPLPPGPELVVALTEAAATEVVIHGRYEDGEHHADRAVAVAAELGLGRPPRALGFRGLARTFLGDRSGLDDMREAIALANEAGQGQEVAIHHLNLGLALLDFEGPAAALELMRAGIGTTRSRGLSDAADKLEANTLDALFDAGAFDEALALATSLAGRLESEEVVAYTGVARAVRVRILAARGRATEAAESLDWLETSGRAATAADFAVLGLGSAAVGRLALGQEARAAALLRELGSSTTARESLNYAPLLPAFVRAAVFLDEGELAEALVAGVEVRNPYSEHALVAAKAILVEARGDLRTAGDAYADATERWRRFGVPPEQAHALHGRGRCLAALDRRSEAEAALRACRALFAALGAAPALAEVDALRGTVAGGDVSSAGFLYSGDD
jgi:class 3 adenylate cyclase/tetratricopeptide (TPR) repeat protein